MRPTTALVQIEVFMGIIADALLAPRTCLDVLREGRGSGWYDLDPDLDGQEEFPVFCNMTSDPVTAILHHSQEAVYKVEGYKEHESYVAEILFHDNVTRSQARSLVMTSTSCSYYLSMTCVETDIEAHSWTSYYGSKEHFLLLGGSFCTNDVGIRTCICGVEEVSDAIEDKGEAGNWPFFPILSLNFGDTNSIGKEFVEYFIGPLVCKQDEILYRWFNTNPDKRLAVDVTAIDWATTAGKCAMSCLSTYNCISFNFQKNLRSICELSSLPWDAKHANYQPLVGWAHYAMRLA